MSSEGDDSLARGLDIVLWLSRVLRCVRVSVLVEVLDKEGR